MRIGVVQLTSTDHVDANLGLTRSLVSSLAERGAEFVALPENFAFLRREGEPIPCAQDLDGSIVTALREMARRHAVWLLGGSFPERIPGEDRVYNTSLLLTPAGEVAARYRKMHLFDVDLGGEDGRFRESERFAPGEEVVVANTPFGAVGLSVCYDLRFPELYRRMADQGVRWIMVPSAFAPHTGKDHWEVLLRARAIENQAFVIAPAQSGRHGPHRTSHGRSMVVDPWGLVLAQASDGVGTLLVDCDGAAVDRVRSRIPALRHRRLQTRTTGNRPAEPS